MSTEVWSYSPQRVLEETWVAVGAIVSPVGPRSDVTGSVASGTRTHLWRLQYPTICTTTEVASMLAFYDARLGGWQSFLWTNPNDGTQYPVAFASDLRADLNTPGRFGIPEVRLRSVMDPDTSSVAFGASSVGIPGFRPSTPGSAGFVVHQI